MGTERSWFFSGVRATARCAAVAVLLVSLHGRFDGNPRVASAAEPAIVIEGARIWDGTGKAAIQDAVLVISGDRIQAVGPRGSVAVPAGAKTVPGQGKTLIPGLINLHGHVGMTRGLKAARENYTKENVLAQLKQYARYGVTTVRVSTDFRHVRSPRPGQSERAGARRRVHRRPGFHREERLPGRAQGVWRSTRGRYRR
jgi:hypothetical protein